MHPQATHSVSFSFRQRKEKEIEERKRKLADYILSLNSTSSSQTRLRSNNARSVVVSLSDSRRMESLPVIASEFLIRVAIYDNNRLPRRAYALLAVT